MGNALDFPFSCPLACSVDLVAANFWAYNPTCRLPNWTQNSRFLLIRTPHKSRQVFRITRLLQLIRSVRLIRFISAFRELVLPLGIYRYRNADVDTDIDVDKNTDMDVDKDEDIYIEIEIDTDIGRRFSHRYR